MRIRAATLGVVLLAAGALPLVGASGMACASTGGPRAALVVDTGASARSYCVALDATTVSGIRLVQLAAAQHGLAYSLGFGGQAVCSLDGVGPAGGDCWASYPDFWGYWHGDGAGGWTWAGGGAASYRVGDGDVEGWSWGSGDAGDTHPRPPATRHAAVCEPLPAPSEPPSGGGGDSGSTGGSGGSGGADGAGAVPGGAGGTSDAGPPDAAGGATAAPEDPGSGGAGGGVTRDERDRADADGDRGGGASTAPPVADDGTDDVIRATGASVPASDGPPAGLVAALVVGIALGVAGWRRLRAPAGRGGG